jgi:hypothetical protein
MQNDPDSDEEELTNEDIAELRAEIDEGIADLDAGRFSDFTAESVIAEMRAKRGHPQAGTSFAVHSGAQRSLIHQEPFGSLSVFIPTASWLESLGAIFAESRQIPEC